MGNDIISLREFARRLNVGEKTIRDGVKAGKIVQGVIIENGKPKIKYSIALKEAQAIGLGHKSLVSKGIEPDRKSEPTKQQRKEAIDDEEIEHIAGLGPETSLVTASRAQKIFQAQLASLQVEEKAGTLINKEEANLQFSEFALRIKSEFESLPGRIGSKLATLKDATSITLELAKEIGKSLTKLADIIDEERVLK